MKALRAWLLLGCTFLMAACGRIEPWGKPYERENLADTVQATEPGICTSV